MTPEKLDKLVRMANQIADFHTAMPEAEAAARAASHLTAYWTPKMIDELLAGADRGCAGLNAGASRAIAALRRARRP